MNRFELLQTDKRKSLPLHSGTNCTAHEVALEDEEEDQYRDSIEHRACDQQIVLGKVVRLKLKQPYRQRVHVLSIRDQQGPEEVVPGTLEAEDSHRDQGWFYQGKNNLVERTPA